MRRFTAIGILALFSNLFGCEKPPQDELVTIGGQEYLIPWQHEPVVSIGQNIHVRSTLKLSNDTKIRMLYDERDIVLLKSANLPFLLGVGADSEAQLLTQVSKIEVSGEQVYCDKRSMGIGLHFTCGIRMQDGSVSWTVNFDEKDIQQAPLFRAEAERILKGYRETANAK